MMVEDYEDELGECLKNRKLAETLNSPLTEEHISERARVLAETAPERNPLPWS